jgi:ketosteroid isomerase-like protein
MSSIARKRVTIALLAAVLLTPALGACGGASDDEQQVRTAATKFFTAVHARDFKTVCGLLSETVLQLIPKAKEGGCEKALSKAPNSQTDAIVTVSDARVRGSRATVTASVRAAGKQPANLEVLLVKEGGDWKVASRI